MPRAKTTEPLSDLNREIKQLRELLRMALLTQTIRTSHEKPGTRKRKKGRPRGDPKINFCLCMPHKLYLQLKNYLETYGEKGESMASIIVAGTEKELKERIARKLAQISILKEYDQKSDDAERNY